MVKRASDRHPHIRGPIAFDTGTSVDCAVVRANVIRPNEYRVMQAPNPLGTDLDSVGTERKRSQVLCQGWGQMLRPFPPGVFTHALCQDSGLCIVGG